MTLDARFVYHYPHPLHPELVERLRSIPGLGYGSRRNGGQLYVPYNATWLVDQTLADWNVPRPQRVKRHGETPGVQWTVDQLIAASQASEAHSWLWSDAKPTTEAPIRVLPFQTEALLPMATWGGGHLWQPPGSGKTLESMLWGLLAPGPIVVVTRAPARTTHLREWSRYSSVVPYVYKPKSQVRKKDRFASLDEYLQWCGWDAYRRRARRPVVIIGWEQVAALHEELIEKVKPVSVIFDESHRAKAMNRAKWIPETDGSLSRVALNNTSESAWNLAKACHRRLCTTATAIRHRTWDLWGQLSLVEPQGWGLTATRFLFRYCDGKPGQFGGVIAQGLTNREELVRRLSYTVHKTPHEVTHAQLPPKRREVVWVSQAQQVQRFKWNLANEEKKAAQANHRNRLTEIRLWEAASKKRRSIVQEVKDAVRELPSAKLFVVTGRRRDCDELGRQIVKALPDVASWCAHGDTPESKRRDIQDEYMAHAGPCILTGTIDAWGESLNLQDTDLLLVGSLPYTPGQLDQLEGRVHRLGQDRPVIVRYLCAENTIDERVASLLLSKLPAVEYVVGAGALDGLADQLKGIENRDEVLAGILDAFEDDDADRD
jgi:hypothetical protein